MTKNRNAIDSSLDYSVSAADQFKSTGKVINIQRYGNGNVNDTFLVTLDSKGDEHFVLQRVNTQVFNQPELVMLNMNTYAEHVRRRLRNAPLIVGRRWEVPQVLLAHNGQHHWIDPGGSFWRAITFIDSAESFDTVRDIEHAEEVFKPIREFKKPLIDWAGEFSVQALNSLFDPFFPSGMQWYWRGHYLKALDEDAMDTLVEYGSNLPTIMSTTHIYPIDGMAHELSNADTAWTNRDARWAQVIPGIAYEPEDAGLITQWSKTFYDAMKPFASSKNGYVNFIMDEGEEKVKGTYGANYNRLAEVKRKYDPENFYHVNQNIKP